MNHIYHSIWNDALGAWIAVSEIASGQGKRSSNRRKKLTTTTPLLATSLLLFSSASWALPTGNELIAGQATVNTPSAGQMQIDQASQQAIINWQGFSIAPTEAVNIQQPNAQAALLNRVVGADASQIQGQLHANGQVYLVNPNGVLFGKTAQVDVGGLIASTHEISNADFMAGKNHFTQNGATGIVENHGTITVPNGGVVALISSSVTNTGTINTPKGTTALAAGKTVDLDFVGDGLVGVKVNEAALNAQITNKGAIQADGGRVVLTAKAAGQLIDTVINQQGIIRAQGLVERNGEIILDGGDNGTVQVSGTLDTDNTNQGLNSNANNGSPNLGLNASTTGGNISVAGNNIQINNGAIITASGDNGGGVITFGDKVNTSQTSVQQGATVSANSNNQGNAGKIAVLASMNNGTVNVAGHLNAAALKQGDGGFIDTSAAKVKIADSTKVNTLAATGNAGTWLIDPPDFTIASTGGDITGATLSTNLGGGNVIITSSSGTIGGVNGDINVNDIVTWAANKLTLNAQRNININSVLNGSGTAKLALLYGQASATGGTTDNYFINSGAKVNLAAGQNFSTQKGSTGAVTNYTVITSLGVQGDATVAPTIMSLQGMNMGLTGNYVLGGDINAAATSGWNLVSLVNQGFTPIGSTGSFTGKFDGLGHTITGLTINSTAGAGASVGLFGETNNAVISNVGLVNGNIVGSSGTGASAGVLVGRANGGSINNAYATGTVTVTGGNDDGGLAGYNSGIISNSYSAVTVVAGSHAGGLVGHNEGTISNSYATGDVTGTNGVGGLSGTNSISGIISNSYATGKVTGTSSVGGLVGINNSVGGLVGINNKGASIINAYATGNATATTEIVGGLVGGNNGTISNTYATGKVTGLSAGGLAGLNNGTINKSFWDTTTTGQTLAADVSSTGTIDALTAGKTTAQMKQMATFSSAGWNIANTGGSSAIWRIYEGNTAPLLRSFLTPLPVYPDGTYAITGVNAAHVFGSGTGLYSDQQFYDIAFVPALPVVKPSDDVKPEVEREVEHKTVIQVNVLNLNFWLSQLTPLQVSTTFLGQYYEKHGHYDDYVDADYGQYENNDETSTTVNYQWHQDHGKKHWYEKKQDHKNTSFYTALLYILEKNGIKLPVGLLEHLKF
ncbi:MAG: filamentous hemagglutinin N-terminal domain-containing protein [Methylococcales bacterium]|nr:filamentous hemagglutinin N-terminal domain-containing protein [Methylococcales bacterium]